MMKPFARSGLVLIIISFAFTAMDMLFSPPQKAIIDESIFANIDGREISVPLFGYSMSIKPDIKFAQKTITQYKELMIKISMELKIDPKLLASIIYCECFFNPSWFQRLEKAMIIFGAKMKFIPDFSIGAGQIRLSTCYNLLMNKNNQSIEWKELDYFEKSYISTLMLNDRQNILCCARLIKKLQNEILQREECLTKKELFEMIAHAYNSGKIYNQQSCSSSYAHLVYLTYSYEPLLQTTFLD